MIGGIFYNNDNDFVLFFEKSDLNSLAKDSVKGRIINFQKNLSCELIALIREIENENVKIDLCSDPNQVLIRKNIYDILMCDGEFHGHEGYRRVNLLSKDFLGFYDRNLYRQLISWEE